MKVETRNVTVTNVPVEDLDLLRPDAVRAGHSKESDAAVVRYSVIELARLKRSEKVQAQLARRAGKPSAA